MAAELRQAGFIGVQEFEKPHNIARDNPKFQAAEHSVRITFGYLQLGGKVVIKTVRLAEAFPEAGFDKGHARKHLLANAGAGYLRACAAIVEGRATFGVNLNVELPLMHLAVELLIKALATGADDAFSSKAHGHRTTKIVKDYANRVQLFAAFLNERHTLELIGGLESAWEPVRYFEAVGQYTGQDYEDAAALCVRLGDEHFRLTGTPIMPHHFPVKKPAP